MKMKHRHGYCGLNLAILLAVLISPGEADSNAEVNLQAHLAALGMASQSAESVPGEASLKGYESPLLIPGAELRTDGITTEMYQFVFGEGGPRGDNAACMMAPVYLSAGHTIAGFFVSVYDETDDYNVAASLRRVDVGNGNAELLETVVSSGNSTTPYMAAEMGLSYLVEPDQAYYVTTCLFSPLTGIFGIQIWYDEIPLKAAGDAFDGPGAEQSPKGFPDGGSGMLEWLIPAAAFSATGQAASDNHVFHFNSGAVSGDDDAVTGGCLMAPVYLPNDAVIHGFEASLYDNNSLYKVYADLRRLDSYYGGDTQRMAHVETTSESIAIQVVRDDTIEYPEVSTPQYSYFVTTCLEYSDQMLYAVRIYYKNRELFSDGFESGSTDQWSSTVP